MSFLQVKTADYVSVITIDRPPANALSQQLLQEILSALKELENRDDSRVIVLKGEGRFFCAGADIKEFTTLSKGDDYRQLAQSGQEVLQYIESYRKPIIAAIHGAALGGGLELAMSCHMRFVSETAKMGLPELQLGIIPGFAGTQRLPHYVGIGKACQMMLTSRPITGVEAVQVGLAEEAYPDADLFAKTMETAAVIAKKSPRSVSAVLELLQYAKTDSFYKGVQKEAERFGDVFSSADAKEGVTAFIEKREPHFKGE